MGCTSAHDNAVAESFFASLTKDLLRRRALRSRAKARTAIFDYIETFYNPIRLHSTLDYLSPADYERIKRKSNKPPNQPLSTEAGAVHVDHRGITPSRRPRLDAPRGGFASARHDCPSPGAPRRGCAPAA